MPLGSSGQFFQLDSILMIYSENSSKKNKEHSWLMADEAQQILFSSTTVIQAITVQAYFHCSISLMSIFGVGGILPIPTQMCMKRARFTCMDVGLEAPYGCHRKSCRPFAWQLFHLAVAKSAVTFLFFVSFARWVVIARGSCSSLLREQLQKGHTGQRWN